VIWFLACQRDRTNGHEMNDKGIRPMDRSQRYGKRDFVATT
jgi:hypothetical protein